MSSIIILLGIHRQRKQGWIFISVFSSLRKPIWLTISANNMSALSLIALLPTHLWERFHNTLNMYSSQGNTLWQMDKNGKPKSRTLTKFAIEWPYNKRSIYIYIYIYINQEEVLNRRHYFLQYVLYISVFLYAISFMPLKG